MTLSDYSVSTRSTIYISVNCSCLLASLFLSRFMNYSRKLIPCHLCEPMRKQPGNNKTDGFSANLQSIIPCTYFVPYPKWLEIVHRPFCNADSSYRILASEATRLGDWHFSQMDINIILLSKNTKKRLKLQKLL